MITSTVERPSGPLTARRRVVVVATALLLAPVVAFAVYVLVAVSFEVVYPSLGFVALTLLSAGAVTGAILTHRRGPRDWYLRGAVWALVIIVLASCFLAYVPAQFLHTMNDF